MFTSFFCLSSYHHLEGNLISRVNEEMKSYESNLLKKGKQEYAWQSQDWIQKSLT